MYAQVNYQKFLIIPIINNGGSGLNESAEISVKYSEIEIMDGENNFNLGTLNRGQTNDYEFSICNLC